MKNINEMKVSEALELLKPIATLYGLKLYKLDEFNLARMILVNLYCQELVCEFYEELIY